MTKQPEPLTVTGIARLVHVRTDPQGRINITSRPTTTDGCLQAAAAMSTELGGDVGVSVVVATVNGRTVRHLSPPDEFQRIDPRGPTMLEWAFYMLMPLITGIAVGVSFG